MRWPGTIQPSRFLSHTGQVLPGVRRALTIPEPAAGAQISFAVPAGVQWWITGGRFTLLTDATVANRQVMVQVQVDGLAVWQGAGGINQAASSTGIYSCHSTYAATETTANFESFVIALPGGYLPQSAVVTTVTSNMDANDQFSAWNLWIEEVYVTDPQLSEIARTEAELNREIAQYEFQQAEQAGGNV